MSEAEVISISDSESSRHSSKFLPTPLKKPQQHVCNQPTVELKNKVITISSYSNQSTERCPVTWNNGIARKNPLKYLDSDSFLSPSPRTKVSSWLYRNCQSNCDINTSQGYTDNKSAILIRQDYRKADITSPNEKCSDRVICIASRGSSSTTEILGTSCSSKESGDDQTLVNLDCTLKTPIPENTQCTNKVSATGGTLSSTSIKIDDDKSISSPTDFEIPNKIELCEYLKLMNMNPIDGKVIGSKQNRRSSRVKNLAIMSEKRALERELNSDNSEKKKSVNGVDPDVKSCSSSDGSKESRGSSKESNGTNSTKTNEKPLRKLSDDDEKLRKLPEEFKNCSIRTKSLQVPEVSTTSTSKAMHNERNLKSSNKRLSLNDKDTSPNSERKSVIMTKKSFTQLNIDISAIKTSEEHETTKNLLLNYIAGIPKTDFEDSFNKYISTEDINKHIQKKNETVLNNSKKVKTNNSKPNNNEIKKKRKVKLLDKFPKSKFRQLHDKLKIKRALKTKQKKKPIKMKQTFRLYSRRNLTKLRSRGRLKEIGIKSVLLNLDKRKKRKRFIVKATQVTPKRKDKEFREAVLIQKTANTVIEQKPPPQTEFSPLKILKLKSEIDLLKNLTPEHRKALFESKKFVIMKTKENLKIPVNDITADEGDALINTKVDAIEKLDKTTETTEDCDSTFPKIPRLIYVAQQTRPDSEISRPTSEDLEVHKLMSSDYLKEDIVREKSNSTEVTSIIKNALDAVLKENWRCSSSSKSASTSTSSLQTVESNREPSNSPNSKTNSYHENPINEDVVETSTLIPDNETSSDDENDYENRAEIVDISDIEPTKIDCIQLADDPETTIKSLHQCLTLARKKQREKTKEERFKTERLSKSERKTTQSYAIELSNSNGAVMNAYYLDYNLVIVQEFLISFWNQTSLGNVLGAQDMWMPKGDTKRIVLGNGCTHKESAESVTVLDNSIAYVELWTKEHKSDKRERPVADIFVTIYLRLNGSGPDKKVLQLENIHGYANDVQYIVLKNSPYIIVSWNTVNDQLTSTVVHKYQLSSDYQAVSNIASLQVAAHYIASLHNIEDSDTLIMGCGEDKITLWHVDDGYIVATMDLMAIAQQPRTLWAKADRGFIFTLHNFNDGYFHLIATNSFDYSWKQLQVYKQETEYENLLGICVENGLVVAFYDTGILCWSAKSGELVIDSPCENSIFLPFGKHIVVIIENQVHVRHVLEYLVTIDDS
ncbi:hypothetical protein RN001_013091 [Aquatica leii]|uniref:Uncharacterized protein n=1 Tax=Aquatica leii TaxID=1421715 RepID=A0AAN7P1U7_9COLE|nr:hypothetical protein RN001_013091 [Aquatica leii]